MTQQTGRIQRKRAKGWKMPENTIYVGRGSVWGNPFVVGKPCGIFPEGMGMRGAAETLIPELSLDQSISFYRDLVTGFVQPEMYPFGHDWLKNFQRKMRGGHPAELLRSLLRGKNLACWCPLDQPCHADVLLELANGSAA